MPVLVTALPLIVVLIAALVFRPGTRLWPHQRTAFLAAVTVVALSGAIAALLSGRSSPLGVLVTTGLWLVVSYQGYRHYQLHRS